MKISLMLLLCFVIGKAMGQDMLIARNGQISFFSETPLENISGLNKNVTAIINTKTSDVAVKMQVAQFEFPNKLMQEHFNENYLESDKYPTASFTGKIQEKVDFSKDGIQAVTAKGILNMHGVAKERTMNGKLTVTKTGASLICEFNVPLADHKIEIPKLVFEKIAEVITIKTSFSFVPYESKK